eukprot:GHVT01003401.1.p1 GENE.GHVT01003401.1~~GHVT01003401.1.p1  ORF type:complete len:117 (-),score=25.57 GHVT01003401.1:151-501(-)
MKAGGARYSISAASNRRSLPRPLQISATFFSFFPPSLLASSSDESNPSFLPRSSLSPLMFCERSWRLIPPPVAVGCSGNLHLDGVAGRRASGPAIRFPPPPPHSLLPPLHLHSRPR